MFKNPDCLHRIYCCVLEHAEIVFRFLASLIQSSSVVVLTMVYLYKGAFKSCLCSICTQNQGGMGELECETHENGHKVSTTLQTRLAVRAMSFLVE